MASMARSIGAVVAGILVNVVLATAIDFVLQATGVFPPARQPMANGLYALAMAYRLAISVAGGYVTARLAPSRPMAHVLALGIIGFVLAVMGTVVMWNAGPHWYPLALVVTALPATWLGGRLSGRG